ncbi:SusC/RagA family TonB-linked outer membrane protein [Flavitalea flava]
MRKFNRKRVRYAAMLYLLLFSATGAWAQVSVTGKITDEKQAGLAGVTVTVKGTQTATTTNTDGSFSIMAPGNKSKLVITSIGYISQELSISGHAVMNVILALDSKGLGEVVVIGYGSQVRKAVTGSVQTISEKEVKDIPVSQITQKLQGRLAGVQINQTTGKPGQGMSVRIRGQLSVSAGSDPLYVIDGFPITGNISNLNPDEIENLSVLKDAASTSLYGSRAANGVVLITTKQGKKGQTAASLNVYGGVQQLPMHGRIKMMNAEEFAEFKKEYYEDAGQPVPVEFQDPASYRNKNNDWYGALIRKAPLSSYNLTITSNTEKTTTSIVAGYFSQQGVVLNNAYTRYSLRMNNSFNISDKVKMGFNIAPQYIEDNTPLTDGDRGTGVLFNALHTWPVMPIRDSTGQLTLYNKFPASTNNIFNYPNWVRAAQEIVNKNKQTNLIANGFVSYTPIKGLNIRSTINVEYNGRKFFFFSPSTATNFINVPVPTTARSYRIDGTGITWLNENLATYTRSFGDHNFELLGGYTNQKFHGEGSIIATNTYTDDRLLTVQGAVNIDRNGTYSDVQEWALSSQLARLTYNYKGKYLASAAFRRDGSSRFGADKRYGTFPSASLGWVVSDENFFEGIARGAKISFAKLRTSYGVIGNNNIGNYTPYALVNIGGSGLNSVFGNTIATGAAVTSLQNRVLSWETTKQFDFGVDLGLLNDRIQFTYDYYTKRTTNLLYGVQVPQESGFSNYTDNIGQIRFWGHEFAVNTRNLEGRLKWTTIANISFNQNIVEKLAPGIDRVYGSDGLHITQVGKPFGQFYGLVADGVYKNQEDLDKSPQIPGRSTVGSIKLLDKNKDGVITYGGDNDDRVITGSPFPKFTYGVVNNFQLGPWDFSITGSGSHGNSLLVRHLYSTANLDGVFNLVEEVKYRFRSVANPGKGFYGTTVGGGNVTGIERDWPNSRFIADASYFTIRNITLGYNVNVKNKVFKSARLYASVQQVYTFTKYWGGPNPETSAQGDGNGSGDNLDQGIDLSNYPVPRTYTIGANINF